MLCFKTRRRLRYAEGYTSNVYKYAARLDTRACQRCSSRKMSLKRWALRCKILGIACGSRDGGLQFLWRIIWNSRKANIITLLVIAED